MLAVGGFPEDLRAGEDTVVNRELWRRGHGAFRAQDVALTHHSRCTTPRRLVKHHFSRGRGARPDHARRPRRGPAAAQPAASCGGSGPDYLPDRLRRIAPSVERWGGETERARYRRVRPLVAAGAVAAWAGTWYEILRPARGKLRVLLRDTRVSR